MHGFTGKGDRNLDAIDKTHAQRIGGLRRLGQAACFIVVGQGPQLNPIRAGAFSQCAWAESAI